MLAFFATALGRKILIYGSIAIALFFAIRWYSNSMYEKGVASGKQDAVAVIQKLKEAEWKAKEEDLKNQQTELDKSFSTVDAKIATANQSQSTIKSELAKSLALINSSRGSVYENFANVPDSALDGSIRSMLAELSGPAVQPSK